MNKWRNNSRYFLFRYLDSTSCTTNWLLGVRMRHGDLKITWRINTLTQELISSIKRRTLTEPHYMFCGTPVEEHWFRYSWRFSEVYTRAHDPWL